VQVADGGQAHYLLVVHIRYLERPRRPSSRDTHGATRMPGTARRSARPLHSFYRAAVTALERARVPFLIGGAYALSHYTGIVRETKDFDLFVMREHFDAALGALQRAGCRTEIAYPHWLGKAHGDDGFVDVIFSSGNGIAHVDEEWFEYAESGVVLGREVLICPAEETLWSKAFIMERERYDGADVAHLLHARGPSFDWARLLRRFGTHWRVLLGHLVMFGYVYPSDRDRIPARIVQELTERLVGEQEQHPPRHRVCNGTVVSRTQYLVDIEERGYQDGREWPHGPMSAAEIVHWTEAARRDGAR